MALEFDKENLIYIKGTIDWMLENMDLKDVVKGSESLHNLSQNSLTAIERGLAQCSNENAALPLQRVSVEKYPLPRPLECWNKARELECGDYIEWHLNKERGNAR